MSEKQNHTLTKKLIIAMIFLIIIGCIPPPLPNTETMKKITLTTSDGVSIVGNYWNGSEKGILLIHMMPATKESWNEFAQMLNAQNYSILAIDLRGHGESGGGDFRSFTDTQHQASIKDVEAAVDYLKGNGVTQISIVGASIGANLALQYQSQHPEIKKTILLSPGTNYRGVLTIPAAQKLAKDQDVFVVGATDDGDVEASIHEIAKNLPGGKKVKIFESSQHGTNLFSEFPELKEEIVEWVEQ